MIVDHLRKGCMEAAHGIFVLHTSELIKFLNELVVFSVFVGPTCKPLDP